MHARVTTIRVRLGQVDSVICFWRDAVLTAAKAALPLFFVTTLISILAGCQPTPTLPPSGTTTQPNMGVVVIHGIFDPAGEKLLELKPTRRYSYNSLPIPNQPQGRFVVRVVYLNGGITPIPFDALVADDAGRIVHGFFEVTVPVTGQIDFILIATASGDKTFARINASDIIQ